jgi:hypothetical protein
MPNNNIEEFGRLEDDGDARDQKAVFVVSDANDGWQDIRLEIDTDDCDRDHALAFKRALIRLWNSQS